MKPVLSVVMSTYNRLQMLPDAIVSVLSQSFGDFEFIIIDDNSTDGTFDYLHSLRDDRIKLFKNHENKGCTFNYHIAQNIAKGKYIAHIDDDDISFPYRFERQISFLESNNEISLLGTFIETFGENQRPSWVFYTEPEKIDLCMNFYNPICHSSIMYRKDFVDKHFINYNLACKCAQDYDFYKQILFAGGKLANIDEILVRYRMHANRLTDIRDSQQIQIDIAEKVKKALQLRFLSEEEHKKISDLMADFPYNDYSLDNVILAISMIEKTNFYSQKLVQSLVQDIKNNLFKF